MGSKAGLKHMHQELSVILDEKVDVSIYNAKKANSEPDNRLPDSIKDFYKSLNHLNYEWNTTKLKQPNGTTLKGRINILPVDQVLKDWNEITRFKQNELSEIEEFKVVDYFVPEVVAGYLPTANKSDQIYLLDIGEKELQPMGVDFNGYMELLFAARGFLYWQAVVLNIKNGAGNEGEVEPFKTYMPQIFPDFKWEEFVALYDRVRIK